MSAWCNVMRPATRGVRPHEGVIYADSELGLLVSSEAPPVAPRLVPVPRR